MRVRARLAPSVVVAAIVATGSAFVLPSSSGAGAASLHRSPRLDRIVLPAIGFGYTVTSQGPLDASRFPAGSPSASAAAGALHTLGSRIDTYERSWQDSTAVNQVQDVLVRFPTAAGARAFIGSARRALAKGEIVRSGALPSIPGAERVTYFASNNGAGVGQTVTIRIGVYAAVLSFFSAASGNPSPITRAAAQRVARAQYDAMVSAGLKP